MAVVSEATEMVGAANTEVAALSTELAANVGETPTASVQAQAMATVYQFAAHGAIQQALVQADMPGDWRNHVKAALHLLAASKQVLDAAAGGVPGVPLATGHSGGSSALGEAPR